ncbi:MAG TPA: hypothetical protein VGG61_15210 [Gemmataceae bacterium]
MATATPPTSQPRNLADAQVKVRHPLQRLRGVIRTYVGIEGATTLFLYLSVWFWVALIVDYGLFKAVTLDWVQVDKYRWLRGIALVGALVGLAAVLITNVALRLFRDFRDSALALVLERRFPKVLGDRLITAVELANPREAAKLGYSPVMIEQTIHEAAARVEQVPVNDVFDWKRLVRRGIWVGVLTLGLYLVTGLVFCVAGWIKDRSVNGLGGFGRFHEVSALLVERDLLLQNTIWPRRAFLEFLNFPEEEIKIGKDAPAPTVRLRAYKWVIADHRGTDEGWRAVRLSDQQKMLGTVVVDAEHVPAWKPRDEDIGLTLDEIEMQMDKPEIEDALPSDQRQALRDLLDKFEARVADPSMRRTLRKLEVPDTVYVTYKGATSKSVMTLNRQEGNEYTGQFSDLKESISFTARGLDYYTPSRQITVVPPPSLEEMTVDLFIPAYRYYRIPHDGSINDLKGKKQIERRLGVSLQSGDKSTILVPAGTDVSLEARSDKPLSDTPRLLAAGPGGVEFNQPVTLLDDHRTFRVQFDNVRVPLNFQFEFRDTDGVAALRRVEITPATDKAPTVDLNVDILRRTANGFMITPEAQIPFNGKVSDDVALDAVEFVYTLAKLDKQTEQGSKALLMLRAAMLLPGGPGQEVATAAALAALAKDAKPAEADASEKELRRGPVLGFYEKLATRPNEYLPLQKFRALLDPPSGRAPQPTLLKDYLLDSSDEKAMFDLKNPAHMPNPLKILSDREIQPEYRMNLWIEAIDNDIETGPHHSQVKERIPFHIVSEEKLILEIGKEEDQLYSKLKDIVDQVETGKDGLSNIFKGLNDPQLSDTVFLGLQSRAGIVDQLLDKSTTPVNEIKTDYDRILRELKTNRVQSNYVKRVEVDICEQLKQAADKDCPAAQKSLAELRAALDAKDAAKAGKLLEQVRGDYDVYQKRLFGVLEAMQKMQGIKDLIAQVQRILSVETQQLDLIDKLRIQVEEKLLNPEKKGSN